jgi:hypothetical protein
MTTDAAITVRAIRDGEPEALAALCAKRGAPVLAYCEHVAAPRQAGKAAANAFAQLRATIVAASETPSPIIDLEAELLASTRRAAAALGIHATAPAANGTVDPDAVECAGLETKLVAQIERPRSDEERQEHAEHIARCPACARAMERLESGQRAFDKPPRAPLPPRIAEQLLSALVQAGPVVALGGDPEAVREQAWQRLGNGAPALTNGSRNGSSHASPPLTALPAPLAGGWDAQEPIAPRAPTRASSRRPSPAPAEAGSLGALVSDAFAVTRHRMLGPRAGSVERPRHQSRILRARGSLALRPADRRRVEFAAVGIFVAVAALVTVVTFMMTSQPSNTSSATPAARLPAASSGSTADAGTAAGGAAPSATPTKPKTPAKRSPAGTSSTAHHTSSGKKSSSTTSSSKSKTKPKSTSTQSASKPKQTESTPAATATPVTPKRSTPVISTPPPPPPSKPSPAKSSGSSIPGGDFSTEGDTG